VGFQRSALFLHKGGFEMLMQAIEWTDFLFSVIASRTECPVTAQAGLWLMAFLMAHFAVNCAMRLITFLCMPMAVLGLIAIVAFYLKLLP
jgi:hypothetical protein